MFVYMKILQADPIPLPPGSEQAIWTMIGYAVLGIAVFYIVISCLQWLIGGKK
jgi:hypothetical protein